MGWQCNGTGRVGKVEETTTNIVKGEKQERKRGGEGRGGEEKRERIGNGSCSLEHLANFAARH